MGPWHRVAWMGVVASTWLLSGCYESHGRPTPGVPGPDAGAVCERRPPTLEVTGTCSEGTIHGRLLDAVAVPDRDGIEVRLNECTEGGCVPCEIGVYGVGSDLADRLQPGGIVVAWSGGEVPRVLVASPSGPSCPACTDVVPGSLQLWAISFEVGRVDARCCEGLAEQVGLSLGEALCDEGGWRTVALEAHLRRHRAVVAPGEEAGLGPGGIEVRNLGSSHPSTPAAHTVMGAAVVSRAPR